MRLRDLGNTLIVVEHDEDTIRAADWVVDIGPGAGEHGGEVVVSGTVEELLDSEQSITGAYLSGRRQIPIPTSAATVDHERMLTVHGRARAQPARRRRRLPARHASSRSPACQRIRQVDAGQRHPATVLANKLNGARKVPGRHRTVTGLDQLDKVVAGRPVADRPHAAVATPPPTPACSTTSASCSPRPPRRRSAATCPAGSRSTSRAAAARRAPATARSRSR